MMRCILASFIATLFLTLGFSQNFSSSTLNGESINNPTSLQFGPDGRLYVSQQNGLILAYTISRNGSGNYQVTATETIDEVKGIQNHNDDGTLNNNNNRQVTGLLVTGTANNPVLYVSSSDPRIGGGGGGSDLNLDTNSGVVSRLIRNGNNWNKVDLVRGLPRSEENHASNGLQLNAAGNKLILAQGGHTNAGAPSNNFAFTTEYALSAAILEIDLNALNAMPVKNDNVNNAQYIYDLPTVDDPTRANSGGQDQNDPFGGNDGLNQARIVPGGPVQIYASGFRNIFDVLMTESGHLYTWDNGANRGWGGHPANEGGGNATNNWISGEPGSTGSGPNDPVVNNLDGLHLVTKGYYGGHPNPIRANPSGAGLFTHNSSNGGSAGLWRTNKSNNANTSLPSDWPPLPNNLANPIEGDFQNPGQSDQSLFTLSASTNGMAEYTASNFNGNLAGNLLAVSFNGNLYSIDVNNAGTLAGNNAVNVLASGFGSAPLDVTTIGDNGPFPGTVWVANIGSDNIAIFEPSDFGNPQTPPSSGDGIYINAGGPTISNGGVLWQSDRNFSGGKASSNTALNIAGTTNDQIYQSERFGNFQYNIPVANGNYTVQLHFAEIWNGATNPGIRIFDLSLENSQVLNNFDITGEVGFATATAKSYDVNISDGAININVGAVANNPKLSAIAIIPQGSGGGGPSCAGSNNNSIDEDGDGYTNADELDNGTDPCNGASQPEDFDGTMINGFRVSNLNDPDDDDDGINDANDKFVWDATNGLSTQIPLNLPLLNTNPGTGFFGLGFTGLMSNGTTDYLDLIQDEDNSSTEIIAGGAVGLFTLNGVPNGDPYKAINNAKNGFQFGINTNSNTNTFIVETRILGPVFTSAPDNVQSVGFFIGNGDQDNYLKMTVFANGGNPAIQVLQETNGNPNSTSFNIPGLTTASEITFFMKIDPSSGLVQPQYALGNGSAINLGGQRQLAGSALTALQANNQAMAIGIISTTNNSNPNFDATWDSFEVYFDNAPSTTPAQLSSISNLTMEQGTQFITFSHTGGTQNIVVQDINLSGSNNFQFNSFQSTPFTLSQGQSFDVEISYSGNGNESAQLNVSHSGSNNNNTVNINGSAAPVGFNPDPNKTYYINSYRWGTRLAANGSSQDAYMANANATGADVEWKFVQHSSGLWHLDRAAGGSAPRLRSDNSSNADMQATSSSGTYTRYVITPGAANGTYFLTLPNGPGNFVRLQVNSNSQVKMVSTSSVGSWESFNIVEVPSSNSGQISLDFVSDNSFAQGEAGAEVVASDSNGSIANVQLFVGNNFIRQENFAPYEWGSYNSGSTDAALSNLAPGTYTLRAVAQDNQGNTAQATMNITIVPQNNPNACDLFDSEDFESGFGIWNDGGGDAFVGAFPQSFSGSQALRLRDNTGDRASAFTDPINFSSAGSVIVRFNYEAASMENGEDFMLEVSTNGGSTFTLIRSWVSGTDFQNGQALSVEEVIPGNLLSNSTVIRIRCDASANADQVYIDDLEIETCNGSGLLDPQETNKDAKKDQSVTLRSEDNPESYHYAIYPNPSSDQITLKTNNNSASGVIVDSNGKMKAKVVPNQEHNVSDLRPGLYFILIQSENELRTLKFIKI